MSWPKFLADGFGGDGDASPGEISRTVQQKIGYAWELSIYCWRQLIRHRAEGMAAELTYRTIFALIPLVVLGLVLFRVVGSLEEVEAQVENQLFSFFGVPVVPVEDYVAEPETLEFSVDPENKPAREQRLEAAGDQETLDPDSAIEFSEAFEQPDQEGGTGAPEAADDLDRTDSTQEIDEMSPPPATSAGTGSATVAAEGDERIIVAEIPDQVTNEPDADEEGRLQARGQIRKTIRDLVLKISKLDFKSIGVVGLLLFIYAAVALADSVEHLFNTIYDAPSSRPIHIRVAIHWSIITLGSGLLALSLYMSSQVIDWFDTIGADSLTLILRHLLSITASWVLLFLLYALMPNTHVSLRSAAIGAIVAALLWEAAKFGFQIYVETAVPYSALYGSLGLIPLFLFWVYLTWWIVLFGVILTFALQTLRGRRPKPEEGEEGVLHGDPDWMVPIMTEIARAFDSGEMIDRQDVADRLGLSGRIVHEMVGILLDAGLLRRLDSGASAEEGICLAKPAGKIGVREILELALKNRPGSDHPSWHPLTIYKQAEIVAADRQSLEDLVQMTRQEERDTAAR